MLKLKTTHNSGAGRVKKPQALGEPMRELRETFGLLGTELENPWLKYQHSTPNVLMDTAILVFGAGRTQLANVMIKKCGAPRFKHGVGNLRQCRFALSQTVSQY